jgi:hypothetical protein
MSVKRVKMPDATIVAIDSKFKLAAYSINCLSKAILKIASLVSATAGFISVITTIWL